MAPKRRAFPKDLTKSEREAVEALLAVAKRWPSSLGIFSWSGSLQVTDRRPEVLHAAAGSGQIRTIDGVYGLDRIPNDGGDPDEFA